MKSKILRLLDAFDAEAQNHGWQRDQGSRINAVYAEVRYTTTKEALVAEIERLQRRIRKSK